MQRVALSAPDWGTTGYLARTFADRFLGVWSAPNGSAVVLRTASVHTFGRRRPLQLIGLDAGMTVVAIRTLKPNRVALIPSARIIVEMPAGSPVPAMGERVEMNHG